MIRGERWIERRSVARREPSGVARATHPSTIALEPRPAPRASESVGSTTTVSASKGLRLTSQWSRNSSTVGHTCNGGSVRRSDAAQYFEALTTTRERHPTRSARWTAPTATGDGFTAQWSHTSLALVDRCRCSLDLRYGHGVDLRDDPDGGERVPVLLKRSRHRMSLIWQLGGVL